jgi:hypothetical protein
LEEKEKTAPVLEVGQSTEGGKATRSKEARDKTIRFMHGADTIEMLDSKVGDVLRV